MDLPSPDQINWSDPATKSAAAGFIAAMGGEMPVPAADVGDGQWPNPLTLPEPDAAPALGNFGAKPVSGADFESLVRDFVPEAAAPTKPDAAQPNAEIEALKTLTTKQAATIERFGAEMQAMLAQAMQNRGQPTQQVYQAPPEPQLPPYVDPQVDALGWAKHMQARTEQAEMRTQRANESVAALYQSQQQAAQRAQWEAAQNAQAGFIVDAVEAAVKGTPFAQSDEMRSSLVGAMHVHPVLRNGATPEQYRQFAKQHLAAVMAPLKAGLAPTRAPIRGGAPHQESGQIDLQRVRALAREVTRRGGDEGQTALMNRLLQGE